VAIDHDSDHVELVRKFGNKVYYGDAARKDLLEAAGAGRAKYFILAIDDVDQSLSTAKLVLEHFPKLKIFARARNRGHVFSLKALGVSVIKREIFDSSLYFVKDLLLEMGFEPEKAFRVIDRFREHDEMMIQEQFKVRNDDKSFMSVARQGSAQLDQVLKDDADAQQSNIIR
jgi:voltage-gated potassium channel Kch